MSVQVTKKQVKTVKEFQAIYPHYDNETILEMAATPRFIPVLCKEAHCLKVVSLIELAHILTGHYVIAPEEAGVHA